MSEFKKIKASTSSESNDAKTFGITEFKYANMSRISEFYYAKRPRDSELGYAKTSRTSGCNYAVSTLPRRPDFLNSMMPYLISMMPGKNV